MFHRSLLPLVALVVGCVNLNTLQSDYEEAKRTFDEAGALNAKKCTPKEYALAEANLAFAELEFKQGDPARARQHLDIALENAAVALKTAPSCLPKDRDNDTITDDRDDCPDEPEDFDGVADEDGCADIVYDSDNDGLADNEDACPKEPEDLDGFKDPDGCPEPDNDNDGVLDGKDACPIEPEDLDRFQDGDGCPDPDNDGDGFADVNDRCPDTPGPDNGCPPRDSDMDGLMDAVDQCPMEAGPAPSGCPVRDTDLDGLVDAADACPNEPGPPPTGCPVRDQDMDGIPDGADRCPAEPETRNEYLDEDGCPDIKPQKVKIADRQIVIEEQIKFETGKAIIRPESYPILDSVAAVMRDYPQITVQIQGHTDSDGDDASNLRLSKDRADAVFEYLIAHGVEARRLETVGYGETRPIDTNRTPQGKQNNRRVEFHIQSGLDEAAPPTKTP